MEITNYTLLDWKVTLLPGCICSFLGCRGKYAFQYGTISAEGEVSLTFVGGRKGHFRSFRPEQIKAIHLTM